MEKVKAGGFVSLFSTPFKWRKEFLLYRSQKDEVGRYVRLYCPIPLLKNEITQTWLPRTTTLGF